MKNSIYNQLEKISLPLLTSFSTDLTKHDNGTIVDKRLVCKYAIETLAASVIIAHNHPSGNTMPSKADRLITNDIKSALNLFDIKLFDHIIITADDHLSFADESLI